ncbi:hypothetical protein Tco_1135567 [Tanacetum coccineum]
MFMTIQSSDKDKILATSSETSKVENAPAEMLRDLDQQIEKRADDDASLHVPLDEIKVEKSLRFVEEPVENSDREVKRLKCSRMVVVKFLFDELRDRVVNDVVRQLKVLTSLLDDVRGSGSWMFLFVWSGYAAMRTLLWAGKFVSFYVGYVRFGNQSIERDRLIGIGFVLDLVEFISFTFGDKEMIL